MAHTPCSLLSTWPGGPRRGSPRPGLPAPAAQTRALQLPLIVALIPGSPSAHQASQGQAAAGSEPCHWSGVNGQGCGECPRALSLQRKGVQGLGISFRPHTGH